MQVGDNYTEFVSKFYRLILDQNITLVYEGEITQEITKAFTSMTEKNLYKKEDNSKVQKRVYHAMVECLQNVGKHSDDITTGNSILLGKGIFIVSQNKKEYLVTTGNVISNEKVDIVKSMIEKFNEMNPDEIKEEYKKMMKESNLS